MTLLRLLQLLLAVACIHIASEPSVEAIATDNEDAPGWSRSDFDAFFKPDARTQTVYLPLRDGMTQWVWMDADYEPQKIQRIVFTVHGYGRDVWNYAKHNAQARDAAVNGDAAGDVPKLDPSSVLLMAPQFFSHGDQMTGVLPTPDPNRQPCYNGSEWAWAMNSICEDPTMSSFEAVDLMTRWMTDGRFPNLNTIVITGHSLGGFFVHHYALIGQPAEKPDVEYHFWVGNPAAYVYLDPFRPVKKSVMEKCPTFDTWPWGLTRDFDTSYRQGQLPTAEHLWELYSSRFVHHAAGLNDTAHSGPGCEAQEVQAASHLERAFTWMARVTVLHSGLSPANSLDYLPNVSHNAGKMMAHPVSLYRLFYENHSRNLSLSSQLGDLPDISNGYAETLRWRALDDEQAMYRDAQTAAELHEHTTAAAVIPAPGALPLSGGSRTGPPSSFPTLFILASCLLLVPSLMSLICCT